VAGTPAKKGWATAVAEPNQSGHGYPSELHAPGAEAQGIKTFLHHPDEFLSPGMTVKEALGIFLTTKADALAVLDHPASRRVVGLLSEQYALRRYGEVLERQRRDLTGE
jgi:CIC family chloride channel protein